MSTRPFSVIGVGHTGITVSDMRRSLHFYRSVLGFAITTPVRVGGEAAARITGLPGAELEVAFVDAPGHPIELLAFAHPLERAASGLRPCDAGFFHLCLKVQSLDEVLRAVKRSGFEALGEVHTITEGPAAGMRIVYVRDPDGVCLELSEEPAGVSFEGLMLARARR
jgi:catechol 2,3-dioxygenase-like lactoylglutathione lyase family enzyme